MGVILHRFKLGWSLRESYLWLLVKKFGGKQRASSLSIPLPVVYWGGSSGVLMPPAFMVIPCVETAASVGRYLLLQSPVPLGRRALVYTINKCKDLESLLPDGYLAFALKQFENPAECISSVLWRQLGCLNQLQLGAGGCGKCSAASGQRHL